MTEKQKAFVDEYLIDLNATRAYKAVYKNVKSDDVAAQAGSRLLRNVKVERYLNERMKDRQKRVEVTQDKVIAELAQIAFTNGSDFAKVVEKVFTNEQGQPVIDPVSGEMIKYKTVEMEVTDNLPHEKKKAISGIKMGKNGIEVSTCDKVRALELLGRHLGMWNDKLQVNNEAEVEKAKKIDNINSILEQMKPPEEGG